MAWSFYFPESIASYQEAARLDPDNPMPWYGLAHAAGPNPNSRYAKMPDDPQGAGLAAIRKALELANNGSAIERDMINALFVLYNKDAVPDSRARDMAYVDALRAAGVNHHGWPDSYLKLGTRVSAAQAQPGDLVYYANGGMGFAHIAVYIGGGKAVHGGWNGNQTVIQTVHVGSGPVYLRVR